MEKGFLFQQNKQQKGFLKEILKNISNTPKRKFKSTNQSQRMGLEKLHRARHTLQNTWSKAHSKYSSITKKTKDINKKSDNLTLFLDLATQEINSNSQHQTCRANHKENNKIGLAFFLFFLQFPRNFQSSD